jgi:hypothetical protein
MEESYLFLGKEFQTVQLAGILSERVTNDNSAQGSKLTYVRQSVTNKNPGGHIDFFTYQSNLAHSD